MSLTQVRCSDWERFSKPPLSARFVTANDGRHVGSRRPRYTRTKQTPNVFQSFGDLLVFLSWIGTSSSFDSVVLVAQKLLPIL